MKNFIFSIFFLFSIASVFAQDNPIKLATANKHDVDISEATPGTYQIQATGNDPYLFTEPFTNAVNAGNTVLTFDYFAPKYLENFQIFFGPPIDEKNSMRTELGIREGWTTQSIDLKQDVGNWGKTGDFLRLDFGTSKTYQIQIRNIRLRKPNAQELAKAANLEKKKSEELKYKLQLKEYLGQKFPYSISNVSVKEKNIIVKGSVDAARNNLYVAEVPIYEDVVYKKFEKVYPVPKGNSNFELSIPRYVSIKDHQSDRLLSKWVLVEKNSNGFALLSAARYADDIVAENDLPEEKLTGKKGLGGFSANPFISDLDSLNITSVTVNMWITQMMRSKASDENIPFQYNGKTYYADRKWVEHQDKTLEETKKRNIIVSSIILIDKAVNCPDKEIGRIFQHPDCDPSGIYSMANMTSEEGVEYYAAAVDFLTKRYGRPDKKYGRVHHWIIHNEVDAGWVWTNMGEKDTLLFMDTYHKSMRLVQNIARKYNPHAKSFITLTHFWNWTEDKHFYLSRDLLNILLKFSAVEGDFDWGIAHHPYPESLFEPKSWLDEKADFTFDTPLITFKNIEVLNAWVKKPETMFQGKYKRTVFLSEQGPNSKDYTEKNLQEQAASIAYLWKKMEICDAIDAYQFHNWIDNRGEGGLRIGLRRFPDDEQDPGGKKPIWYVYRDLDTPAEDKAVDFAKKIIGINNWSEAQYTKPIK